MQYDKGRCWLTGNKKENEERSDKGENKRKRKYIMKDGNAGSGKICRGKNGRGVTKGGIQDERGE